MSRIKLQKLTLRNFKGIKDLSLNFQDCTNIKGDNATGKTTVFDAFTWLLFDKDSSDRQNFEIKTLDSNNEVIHGLEHEVTGVLTVDGKAIILTKTFKEKWTKKKGEAERQLTGHETLYYIDEVPVKQSEYKAKVNSLVDESIFRLITNPLYFSTNVKWQDRRKVILDIIGDITTDRIINYKPSLRAIEKLLVDKEIDTLKKSIAARKRKLNEEIKSIPYRIDELNNSIEEYNYAALETEVRKYESYLKEIEEKLMDSSKVNEEVLKDKNRLYELKSKLSEIEYKAKSEAQLPLKQLYSDLNECEREYNKYESLTSRLGDSIQSMEDQIIDLEKQRQELTVNWYAIKDETLNIPEHSFICPTCRRAFEAEDIESKKKHMQENFNENKAKRLAEISAIGKAKRDKIEKFKIEVENSKKDREVFSAKTTEMLSKKLEIKEKISSFTAETNFESNAEYQRIKKQIEEIEVKLSEPVEKSQEIAELRTQKTEFTELLYACKKKLGVKEQNEKFKVRINELMEEEKKLAQQIAELEGQEFLCEEYIKTKVELLESSINKKFKFVSFKLFNTLVNGAVEECCEALINGVPFSDANTASQINAGLDIINALCEHYDVEAPIFIDNRESVNEILDCNSQIINLIVSNDKNLIVENIESEVA